MIVSRVFCHIELLQIDSILSTVNISLPIVFSVPVYLDMPQQNAPMPGEEYNPNNWLKELHIYDSLVALHFSFPK